MKKIGFTFILIISNLLLFAYNIDSLHNELLKANNDDLRARIYRNISLHYYSINRDSVIKYCHKVIEINGIDSTITHCKAEAYEDFAHIAHKNNQIKEEEEYLLKALELYEKINFRRSLIKNNGNLATLCLNTGRYPEAVKYYNKSLENARILKDTTSLVMNYINMGNVCKMQGKFSEAIEYYMLSLKNAEAIKHLYYQAVSLNGIGVVHWGNKSYDKAIGYIEQSLSLREKLNDKKGASTCYLNLGILYDEQGYFDEAIIYYQKSLKLKREVDDKYGVSKCFNNIGTALKNKKEYNQAIEYFFKALDIKKEYSDKDGIALVLENIAILYNAIADSSNISYGEKVKSYEKAISFGLESFKIAKEVNANNTILQSANVLKHSYAMIGKYAKAIEYANIVIAYKDTLFSSEKAMTIAEIDTKYQSEKKQLEIDNLEKQSEIDKKEIEVKNAESKQQKILIYSFILGFIIIFIFSVFLYRLFIHKKKANLLLAKQNQEINQQKEEIESQRDMVIEQKSHIEEQKKEITDSINYARQIQNALLPNHALSKQLLNEYFIIYKPKDIVSGDFFWFVEVEKITIIAVADCTGHGVPGGFMSMLGMSLLKEIVVKEYITNSAVILRRLRKEIINSLGQTGASGEQKDGMDIALCAIDYENMKMQFSGANNPLYLVRRLEDYRLQDFENQSSNISTLESSDSILIEIKGDKMPIAIYDRMDKFKLNEINLIKGDCLYLFSDGYADQFGGIKGKKFLYKNFKKLLIENSQLQMSAQKEILEQAMQSWIGEEEQVDDITILGIKI